MISQYTSLLESLKWDRKGEHVMERDIFFTYGCQPCSRWILGQFEKQRLGVELASASVFYFQWEADSSPMLAMKVALLEYCICKLAQDPEMPICYLFDSGRTSPEDQTNHVRGGERDHATSFH